MYTYIYVCISGLQCQPELITCTRLVNRFGTESYESLG